MKSGIYEIFNVESGQQYIGSAVDILKRWRSHRVGLIAKKHDNIHLQRAWNKYGSDAFVFSVIENAPKANLIEREQFWMDAYDAVESGYNICPTAGSSIGMKTSSETRVKQSIAAKKQWASSERRKQQSVAQKKRWSIPEAKARISAAMKDRKFTSEHRAKISAAQKKRWLLPETRVKQSATMKGRKLTPETKAKLSEINVGRQHSLETRVKMSASAKERYARQQTEKS